MMMQVFVLAYMAVIVLFPISIGGFRAVGLADLFRVRQTFRRNVPTLQFREKSLRYGRAEGLDFEDYFENDIIKSASSTDILCTMARFSLNASISLARDAVRDTIYPAIEESSFLRKKYPHPEDRTPQHILGGLSNVVDIDYLHTLPTNDPRRRLIGTIKEPGPDRRAELEENLQAIDAARGPAAQHESTRSVYEKRSRDGIDTCLSRVIDDYVELEFAHRSGSVFFSDTGFEQLSDYVEERVVVSTPDGLVCKHPCLSTFFPYYEAGVPQKNYTKSEVASKIDRSRRVLGDAHVILENLFYPAIAASPLIAKKYPDPADRTVHKLFGGLMNIVSIEYMQSLEPHDPRRLFLDTIPMPSIRRRVEVEANVLLVDSAVRNVADISIRQLCEKVVEFHLEFAYASALHAAYLGECLRRQQDEYWRW